MQKKVLGLVSLILIVSILSISFVSAGWFGDMWGNIFGKKIIASPVCHTECTNTTISSFGTYDFGGMYTYYDYPNTKCYANPATGGCSCPAGYSTYPVSGEINVDNTMNVCLKPHESLSVGMQTKETSSAIDFGGLYGWVSPYTAGSCWKNPLTNTCGCPTGYTATIVNGQSGLDNTVVLCWKAHTSNSYSALDLGGMYGTYGAGSCYANPATGTCGCPKGYTAGAFRYQINLDNPSYYCYKTTTTSIVPSCVNVCEEVACLNNTDCPKQTEIVFCGVNSVCKNVTNFECVSPATNQSKCVAKSSISCSPCTNGCANGACKQAGSCTDSDGGKNYYVKGKTTGVAQGINVETSDFCKDESTLIEAYCDGNSMMVENSQCAYGCSEGACIPYSPDTCIDSDGGIVPEVKGTTRYKGENKTDECYENKNVREFFCSDLTGEMQIDNDGMPCSYKCEKGACIIPLVIENAFCKDLINEVAYPVDKEITGIKYMVTEKSIPENRTWKMSRTGKEETYTSYGAQWRSDKNYENEDAWTYISYDVYVFHNKGINLSSIFTEITENRLCYTQDYYPGEDERNIFYVCNWDVLSGKMNNDIKDVSYAHRQVFWYNGNVLVMVYGNTGKYLSESEMDIIATKRIESLVSDLVNNKNSDIREDIKLPLTINNFVQESFSSCVPHVDIPRDNGNTCLISWDCRLEPAICPEYGYRTRTCVDRGCNTPTQTEQLSCNPGMCSGCYVSKWFGNRESNDERKCIPFGFRFEQEVGTHLGLIENVEDETIGESESNEGYKLEFVSPEKANLVIYGKIKNYSYKLVPGAVVKLDMTEYEIGTEITLTVVSMNYNKRTIDLSIKVSHMGKIVDKMNAYCDIDGIVKKQVAGWQKCSNNYECESNICSNNECYDVQSMLKSVSSFKSLGVKVLCKLAGLFKIKEYNSCVAGYLP